jgi:GTP-binding protein
MERAHVVALVVDATEGFHRQEARLAQDALEAGRSVLLLYNKWDRVEGRDVRWKELEAERADKFPTLADVPAMPISATVGTHLHRLPRALRQRVDEMNRRIGTRKLNDWLAAVQRKRQVPSTRLGRSPKIYYLTQSGQRPPEFTFFVNNPEWLDAGYRRFLWSRFAETFGFHGTPVRFRFRKSE